ncbi:ABC transporter ATP-binding protein [Hoeflea prorocentri]|uniref:ABC transporter ATP-binding protein n=1 Tax=Hoeflea prorocentri TaxID=1922333 RepID=A0A9X3UJA6_9HYPH|nr:ABC transporter ATP-binding protein [Hoeflea prorocentri]MCY6381835.1 ABC transporter ATP-binding protein [Hoeflea prorocentri]MDA5399635.1 ABC transporter ATP-binding protein [Hoeflea prorocentri]
MTAALEIKNLRKVYTERSGLFGLGEQKHVVAVDDVSLTLHPGETLCLVGESGCGKTTVGRLALRLTEPTDGSVSLAGMTLKGGGPDELSQWRRRIQMVFQDPFACLNPRMSSAQIVAEPIDCLKLAEGQARERRISELFDQVGLPQAFKERRPRELSGGQRQRLGIARALAANPRVIVADEAVAALDVSIRSQVLNLLKEVQKETGVAYLFISHDLSVVRYLADHVAVMYLGAVVETGTADQIFNAPSHPYTRALIASVPATHPSRRGKSAALSGEVPSPYNIPSGCRFRTRCPLATDLCAEQRPEMRSRGPDMSVACHHSLAT